MASTLGAMCRSLAYSALGYVFADRIAGIAPVIGSSIGLAVAGQVVVGALLRLVHGWRSSRASGFVSDPKLPRS